MKKIFLRKENGGKARVTSYAMRNGELIYVSFFCPEKAMVKSLASALMLKRYQSNIEFDIEEHGYTRSDKVSLKDPDNIRVIYKVHQHKKCVFVSAMCYPKSSKESLSWLVDKNDLSANYEALYSKLMEMYDLPLLMDWVPAIKESLERRGYLSYSDVEVLEACDRHMASKQYATLINMSQMQFDDLIINLVRSNGLLSAANYTPLGDISGIDDFYLKYGEKILSRVSREIKPLVKEPKAKVENITLKKKRLFPQQAYVVNGAVEAVKKHGFAYLIEEMGCGKSVQAVAVMESVMVDRYIRKHNVSKEEAIKKVTYRNMIMCPGHLVEKWKKEISEEIPFAHVTIIRKFNQLTKLAEERGKKPKRKDFYIVSKDFFKLGYQERPLPQRISVKKSMVYVCDSCFTTHHADVGRKCECGGIIRAHSSGEKGKGLVCPSCMSILRDKSGECMTGEAFAEKSTANSNCTHCGASLWGPLVENIGGKLDTGNWTRASIYRNASQKGRKTLWIHKDELDNYTGRDNGYRNVDLVKMRKVSPAFFIKRKLGNNFFDFATFDEAHQYSGGGSAQGHSMQALVNCSKYQLALTGTIANGYVTNMFYLFWRLQSFTMKAAGYDYHSVMQFAERYGTIETKYELKEGGRNNICSRGRMLAAPVVKPGISPLIYTDFLFEYSVYLNISDLSNFMPPYVEKVVGVKMDNDVSEAYFDLTESFKEVIQDQNEGGKLMSTMFQTLIAYPDKPYGFDIVKHPKTGDPVVFPADCEIDVLPKEERLIEIVNSELSEGRNCFIFCEFTSSGEKEIATRIKEIVEENCNLKGRVAILRAASPSPDEREAYIHQKAKEGIKVFITHPKCVETGLDLVFEKDGKWYNYPTLIFYQLGTSLFTLWQASRRSYRLIQKEECRTYYFAYENTIQHKIVELMGKKKMSTSILQGKFSADALCTNSGDDVRYALQKSLEKNVDKMNLVAIDALFQGFNNSKPELTEDEKAFLAEISEVANSNEEVHFIFDTSLFAKASIKVYEGSANKSKKLMEGQVMLEF